MEVLSCKTPGMAEKEIWVYLLAYNLIRAMMAQAATLSGGLPRQISFKHTVQLWMSWHRYGLGCDPDQIGSLLMLMAQQRVGDRPGRIEPRALKRRNKPFPLLMMVRTKARDHVRRYGHPKKVK